MRQGSVKGQAVTESTYTKTHDSAVVCTCEKRMSHIKQFSIVITSFLFQTQPIKHADINVPNFGTTSFIVHRI
jgi:hypothetical protein